MVVQLANVFLRRARNTSNARQYLLDIIDAKADSVVTQTGQIIGTTVNGKSLTLQSIPGANLAHVLAAAELALSTLESGLASVPRSTFPVVR